MSQYYYNPFGGENNNNNYNQNYNQNVAQFMYERQLKQKQEKQEIRKISLAMGCAIIAYLVIQTALSLLLPLFGLSSLYNDSALFQGAFNVLAVSFCSVAVPFGVMALINKKKYISPIVPTEPLKLSESAAWIGFGMMCCIIANYGVSFLVAFLKSAFNVNLTQNSAAEPDSVLACIMCLISTAIIPAICEEFAMRCCSLQLLKKYGKVFAVVAVSIVFGLLHGNVIQFIFAFLIGLALAFITIRTDSVLPAMFVHAFNNGMSVVQSITTYASGEKASRYVVAFLYVFWIVAGIISMIILAAKKKFKKMPDNYSGYSSTLSTGQKFVAFLFPWMIIPFVILILLTATTVSIG